MVTHGPDCNIRRIYSRPRQRSAAADLGKVPTCVQVAMRPETTVLAHEMMLVPFAQDATGCADLTGIGGIDVADPDAHGFGLVRDKGLQLSPGPAMQSRPHPLPRLDAGPDVGQILHRDPADTGLDGILNDRLARFVIDVPHPSLLFTGDLPELLPGALTAVGLKTTTVGKVTIALVAQVFAAIDLAQAMGGKIVFSDIDAHHGVRCHGFNLGAFDDEVKVPRPFAMDQFRLFRLACGQDVLLMLAQNQGQRDAPVEGVERYAVVFDRVGTLVEMYRGPVEANEWNRLVFLNSPQLLLRLVRLANGEDGVAAHLAAKRGVFAQRSVGLLMQADPVPQTMRSHYRYQPVAGFGIGRAQGQQRRRLVRPDRSSTHHGSASPGYPKTSTIGIGYTTWCALYTPQFIP